MSISEVNSLDHVPNYVDPSTRTAELLTIHITMIALASLVVALRLISRYLVVKNPGWDDYMIILAMVNGQSITVTCGWLHVSGFRVDASSVDAVMYNTRGSHAFLGHQALGASGVYLDGEFFDFLAWLSPIRATDILCRSSPLPAGGDRDQTFHPFPISAPLSI